MSLNRGRRREFGCADAEWLAVMEEGETEGKNKKKTRLHIPLFASNWSMFNFARDRVP